MDSSFLTVPRYKLNGTQYSWMVSKLSDLLSSVTENRENLYNRYALQFKGDLSLSADPYSPYFHLTCRGQMSYPIPTKREHELILSYGTIIKKKGEE